MTQDTPKRSNCHNASVTIGGDDREGTHYYVCSKCNNLCGLTVTNPSVDTPVLKDIEDLMVLIEGKMVEAYDLWSVKPPKAVDVTEIRKAISELIATKQTEAKDEIRFDVTKDLYELADRNSTIKPEEVWKVHGKYLDQINGSIAELRNTKVEK